MSTEPKPPRRKYVPRARYPQKCLLCGHTWLSFTWKGPRQCPFSRCTSERWREGPSYLTRARRAQGWKRRPGKRGDLRRAEMALLLAPGEPIEVEPIGLLPGVAPAGASGGGEAILGEVAAPRQDAREGPQEPAQGSREGEVGHGGHEAP